MPIKKLFSRISPLAILCISALPLLAQQMAPASAEITVIGVGTILANDVAAARDQAIDDAMRKAVQQALGTYIKSETLVENFQLVDDRILAWSAGYVKKYDILSEGKKVDTYEVQMRATVNLSDLRTDDEALAALLEKENPRVMVMIAEQNIGETNRLNYFEVDMTAAETAIIDVFRSKGFEVVDAAQAKENQQRDLILNAIEGNAKSAAAIAAAQQAELIITGKAFAKVATGFNLGGMKSCQGNITTRIISADDAKIIATASENAAYPHIDEVTGGTMAIQKAAQKCAQTLVTKVTAEAQKRFYNPTTVNLRVQGYRNYAELQKFSELLKYYMRGVKSVFQRSAAGGYANLDVKILGNARQMARELGNKDFSPFKVEVTNVTANRVEVKISSASEPAEIAPPDTSGVQ
ncbi:MAG: hypothetical protein ONB44_00215 [candidate division KSB1 bacterium]|nr:hypothetical protein [candidate division KSB1 bacterium]MDZ7300546.1 hypothetical protein [candidate division KSB1 bacterium]MDZ7309685.1 hypothetical protein [candidate division KSB1 bacterium]